MGIEPTISAGERPQTYALDRAATGPAQNIDKYVIYVRLLDKKKSLKMI